MQGRVIYLSVSVKAIYKGREALKGIVLLSVHLRLHFAKKAGRNFTCGQTFRDAGGAALSAVCGIVRTFIIRTGTEGVFHIINAALF